ncbi:HalOD1 output domain-containing protein [Halomarina oriensis]|uniref:Halobacterial output domain-containing protein n=1 Tax=Halomarina oriensis TaxID=671145 RepID=A0A6B0GW60_9EURY|nr:hypothetical protein [Halomarina oriensis]
MSAGPTESLVVDIVYELADARGVDPLSIPPLGDSVDVDALTTLLETSRDGPTELFSEATFSVGSDEVRVASDGSVAVNPHDTESTPRLHRSASD